MKKGLIGLLVIICLFLVSGCEKPVENNSNIMNFTYDYGSYNGGYCSYSISREDDKIHFYASGMNGVDLNVDKEISESDLNQLAKLINENEIYTWDGFHKSDSSVLDGYSFSIEIQYSDGTIMTANGYMKYPKNYDAGHEALTKYLEQLSK